MNEQLLDRFLRYVKIDTQSVDSVEIFPSSDKQKDLLRLLLDELRKLGISAYMDERYGYVYASIPANVESKTKLGFIAHVDTSPAVSGKGVKPIITADYDGGDITLAEGRVLSPDEFAELKTHVGKTIISSDGTTLLGADDKAGVAVIMQLAETLAGNPDIPHGEIKIAFTPDEEVGRGTDFFDVKGFGADYAYTIDGGGLGELEYENFNAADVRVNVSGKSVHPGSAKGVMVNASLVLMELQSMLPQFENPAYTEGYEGFYFLESINGECDHASSHYIIRDHDRAKFEAKKVLFAEIVTFLNKKYGDGKHYRQLLQYEGENTSAYAPCRECLYRNATRGRYSQGRTYTRRHGRSKTQLRRTSLSKPVYRRLQFPRQIRVYSAGRYGKSIGNGSQYCRYLQG